MKNTIVILLKNRHSEVIIHVLNEIHEDKNHYEVID